MPDRLSFFKQKTLWLGLIASLTVVMIFGLALVGPMAGAAPKNLPVALVNLDQTVNLPGGQTVAVGETVTQKLLSLKELPVQWQVLNSEAEALAGLDGQRYYGALILPADVSQGVVSLQTSAPRQSTIQIYINEGMNVQASSAVQQILQQVMLQINSELSRQLIAQIGSNSAQIPLQAVEKVTAPLQVQVQTLHPVGQNNASGNAPVLLTQVLWIGTLVMSVFLYLAARKTWSGSRWVGTGLQLLSGLIILLAATGLIVWMATGWYGMAISDPAQVWLFLVLAGTAFFLLQTALLNWVGLPAISLLVLLFFFSLPVVNLAPEFLPQAAHDWLYSWVPFRFAASGLRTVMYFAGAGETMAEINGTLGVLAGICLLLDAASPLKSRIRPKADNFVKES